MEELLQFRNWSNVRADLAWIYEGTVTPFYRDAKTPVDYLGAWLILKGTGEAIQNGKSVVAHEGEWLILRKAEIHQRFSADARILSVRFQAEWPDRKPFFDEGLSAVFKSSDYPELEAHSRRLLGAVRPILPEKPTDLSLLEMDLTEFIRIKAAFWAWFQTLYEVLAKVGIHPTRMGLLDERVMRILHTLDHCPLTEKMRESDLAKSVGLSTAHFVHLFRSELGTTPKKYFDERRAEASRKLLSGAEVPVKEIAYNLGFKRLSDFSAWFKDKNGCAPRKYREEECRRHLLA